MQILKDLKIVYYLWIFKNKGSKQQDLRNGEGPNGDMYGGLGNRWLLNGSKGLGGLGG